jgi:hypothetical protein
MAQDASAPVAVPDTAPGYSAYRTGTAGDVHNEPAFRYFLAVERRRAEQAGRSVLLVLVSLHSAPGRSQRLAPPEASAIFRALGASVREVDFVGWFRDGHVAAAALIQRGRPDPNAIAPRIVNTLKRELGEDTASLRLRVIPLGGHTELP